MDEYYKAPNDENFGDILNKYEFSKMNRSKYIYQEPVQLILKNYISQFTPYNSILLYHDVGVGKTCSAITIAEGFKEYIMKMNKRIVVLVKNQNIEKNFINELLSDCTMGEYSIISEEQKNKLRRFINQTYNIITYGSFVNRVLGSKTSRGTRKPNINPLTNLNNSIIIIDEVHNITNNDTYHALYKILKSSFNYRLILLTATPIYDNPKEIIEISNLLNIKESYNILPIRNELIDKKNKNPVMYTKDSINLKLKTPITHITDYGKELLKKALIGKISYLSTNVETNPKKIEIGEPLLNKVGSKNVVYCEMSEYQYNIYNESLKLDLHMNSNIDISKDIENLLADENMSDVDSEINDDDVKELKSSSLYKNCSDASTMTYPNGLYGKEGFKLLQSDKSILKLPKLQTYSSKLATLLNNINNSKGNIFIYSNYVNNGGISLIKEMLLANNYKLYSKNSSPNNKSFIVFDEKLVAEKRDKLRKVFNSSQNKNGDIIKIIIGSPIISEGITLKNVRQVHILEPTWNMSRINQIIGRAVRNYSHKDLPLDERYVEIFKYVSVYSKNKTLFIDKEKYILSEEKDRSNKVIERLLKQISFDCFINKERNQNFYNQYTNGSAECDYETCALECTVIPKQQNEETKYDYTTYNINIKQFEIYAINYTKNKIKDLFEIYFIWKLQDIINHIKKLDETISLQVIYTALDELVSNKTTINDTFGRDGYIIIKGEYYIFNPINIDINNSIYSKIFDFSNFTNDLTLPKFVETQELPTKIQNNKKEKKPVINKQLTKQDIIYNDKIKNSLQIYGTYRNKEDVYDKKFRLVDTRTLTKKQLQDERKKITGKDCKSFSYESLIDIIKSLNVKYTDMNNILNTNYTSQDEFLQKIKNKSICAFLQVYLEKSNKVLK